MADTSHKIVRQLEYYFGDINIAKDTFMQEEMKKDDGWFSLETMLKFQRLKQLAETSENVVSALKDHASELVELSEDATKVRRINKELPESFRQVMNQHKESAVYVKGIPSDADLNEVQDFLEKHGGPTIHIQMRKDTNTKKFKGSIYATFSSKEDAEKFLKSGEAANFRSGEVPLERSWRDEHFAKKKEKTKQEKDARAKERAAAEAKRQEERAAFEKEKLRSKIIRGSLLKLGGVSQPTEHEKESELYKEMRALLQPAGQDLYLDFFEGVLYARFKEENSAATAWQKLQESAPDSVLKFHDVTIEGSVPSGDEEERLWMLVFEAKRQRFENSRGRGRSGRGRGGRGRFHRNHGSRNGASSPPPKKAKVDG